MRDNPAAPRRRGAQLLALLTACALLAPCAPAARAQAPAGSLTVVFLIDQSFSMADGAYCGTSEPSDPLELRFHATRFALDWLGRAYVSYLARSDARSDARSAQLPPAVRFGAIYFGEYGQVINPFAESSEDGLLTIAPASLDEWRRQFDDYAAPLSPDAAVIAEYNTARNIPCPTGGANRVLGRHGTDPLGALEALEQLLVHTAPAGRILAVLVTDGLPNVSAQLTDRAGVAPPADRFVRDRDAESVTRYMDRMRGALDALVARFPRLDLAVVPLVGGSVAGAPDRYQEAWRSLDANLVLVRDRLTLGARFQEILDTELRRLGGSRAVEYPCGATIPVPPLTDSLELTLHKPGFDAANPDDRFILSRNGQQMAVAGAGGQDMAPPPGLRIEIDGRQSPIEAVRIVGPSAGAWQVACPDYGIGSAQARVFAQFTPLLVTLVAPTDQPWAGLPLTLMLAGVRPSGEQVALAPYLESFQVRPDLRWQTPDGSPPPASLPAPAGAPADLLLFAPPPSGAYTVTLASLAVGGETVYPDATVHLAIAPVTPVAVLSAAPLTPLIETGLQLRFTHPDSAIPWRDPAWWQVYGWRTRLNVPQDGGRARAPDSMTVVLATPDGGNLAGSVRPLAPGNYRVVVEFFSRAAPAGPTLTFSVPLRVEPWPAPRELAGLPATLTNWLQTYPLRYHLTTAAGSAPDFAAPSTRYQALLAVVANGDRQLTPLTLTASGEVTGGLQLNLDPTAALVQTQLLLRAEPAEGMAYTITLGSPQTHTLALPMLELATPGSLAAGCLRQTETVLRLTGPAGGLPAHAGAFQIAPTLVRSLDPGERTRALPLRSEPGGWFAREMLCWPDIWKGRQLSYRAAYTVLDEAGAPVAAVPPSLLLTRTLQPPLLEAYGKWEAAFARRPAQTGAMTLAGPLLLVLLLVRPTPGRIRRWTLRARELPPEVQEAIHVVLRPHEDEPSPPFLRLTFEARHRRLQTWRTGRHLAKEFDRIEIEHVALGGGRTTAESTAVLVRVPVRGRRRRFWIKDALLGGAPGAGQDWRQTPVVLPGGYRLYLEAHTHSGTPAGETES